MTETDTSADAMEKIASTLDENWPIVANVLRALAAKVEALEEENEALMEVAVADYERGQMDGRDKERERAAQVAEQWIAKDMREQMEPGAIEQNAIARQIAAAIRKGGE